VFGDLIDDERFTSVYRRHLDSLYEVGARATLEKLA
jgi:mannitol 2-dehydrogenase